MTRRILQKSVACALGSFIALQSIRAQTLWQYEMCLSPDDAWYAAHGSAGMTRHGDGFGDTASGDYDAPHWAGLQNGAHGAPVGTARFVDTGSHGNDGYTLGGFTGPFTVDMCLASEAAAQGSPAKSFSVRQAAGNGRGVAVNPGAAGGNSIALRFVDGSGVVATIQVPKTQEGTNLHIIRLVLPNDGSVYVYDLETDNDPGPGHDWNLLGFCVLGGSGFSDLIPAGGVGLGSLAGASTTFNKTLFDWVRVDTGTNRGATGEVIPPGNEPPCTPPCSSDVTPVSTQKTSAFHGEAATPGSLDFAVFNLGETNVNWTVEEALVDGTPADYAWLEVNPTSGAIAAGAAPAAVTAIVNATAEPVGTYPAYLRFEDDCTVAPLSEGFAYPAGVLLGNDGWEAASNAAAPDASDGSILVTADGALQLLGRSTAEVGAIKVLHCDLGLISVRVKAKAGAGENFIGNLQVVGGGAVMGWWQLKGTSVAARDPVNNVNTPLDLGADYTELEMRINTATRQTEYWYGQPRVHLATYPFSGSATDGPANIQLRRSAAMAVAYPNEFIFLDDLSVSYVGEHYKLRRIDLEIIGCRFSVTPRSEYAQGCGGGSAARVFTITNTGAYDLDRFSVSEVEPVNGLPREYPWLTLTDTAGLSLPRNTSQDVLAQIDLGLVAPPGETASLQFAAECGATPVRDTLVDAVSASMITVSDPQIVTYLGDALPLDKGFTLLEGTEQSGSGLVDDLSSPPNPAADAQDGKAFFIQDASCSPPPCASKTKYRYSTSANIDPARGATIIGRLKTTVDAGAGDPRNHLGNLFIWHPTASCEVHWGGPNGLLREANNDRHTWIGWDANYHIIRMTVRYYDGSLGVVINIYFDENPKPALQITDAAWTGSPDGITAFGWGVGGSYNEQHVYFDWVAATDAGAFAPGEELSCLACEFPDCEDNCLPVYCREPAGRLFADADGDLDVDMADFATLQLCQTTGGYGPVPPLSGWCTCLDRGDDDLNGKPDCNGLIDAYDLRAFLDCATGPSVPWSQELAPNCQP